MAKRSKRNKPNATGRNSSSSRFARLDHRILNSSAYRSLSPNARSLLVELIMLYNGENNGSLYLGVRDAAHRMGVADLTAAVRALNDLQELGFIEVTQDAYFQVKASNKSRARCWRLTWLPGPGRKHPRWDFLEREPEPGTQERKRMERGLRSLKAHRRARDQNKLPVLESETLSTLHPELQSEPVLDSNTLNPENGNFPPKSIVQESHTHVAITIGDRAQNSPIGGWRRTGSNQRRRWRSR
jgi:hypothetical protein